MEMNNMGKRKNRQKKQAKKKAAKQMKITQKNTGTWVSKQTCHTGHNLIFKTDDGVEVHDHDEADEDMADGGNDEAEEARIPSTAHSP